MKKRQKGKVGVNHLFSQQQLTSLSKCLIYRKLEGQVAAWMRLSISKINLWDTKPKAFLRSRKVRLMGGCDICHC